MGCAAPSRKNKLKPTGSPLAGPANWACCASAPMMIAHTDTASKQLSTLFKIDAVFEFFMASSGVNIR